MDNLSNDIVKYKKGELTPGQMHALEKKALSDPFLAEALEGLENFSPELLATDISALNKKIISKNKKNLFTPLRMAAGVVLLLSSIFLIYHWIPKPETLALVTGKPKTESAIENSQSKNEVSAKELETEKDKNKVESETWKRGSKQKKSEPQPPFSNLQPQESSPKNPLPKTQQIELSQQNPAQSLASAEEHQANVEMAGDQKLNEAMEEEKKASGAKPIALDNKKESFALSRAQRSEQSPPKIQSNEAISGQEVSAEDASQLSEVVVTGFDNVKDDNAEPIIKLAEPLGGKKAYNKYLESKLQFPEEALKNKIKGKASIEFKVNKDGSLSDFRVIKKLGYGCEEEIIRLVKEGPKWIPTTEDSKPIESTARVQLRFDSAKAPR